MTVGVSIRPSSTCANFNTLSTVLRQTRGSDERATRFAPAIASSAGSHTLFYRVTGEGTIDVVRVLHQRMDVDRNL